MRPVSKLLGASQEWLGSQVSLVFRLLGGVTGEAGITGVHGLPGATGIMGEAGITGVAWCQVLGAS